ncbi:hypothetical protein CEXT_388311 [Caerostris extrusa]|uniref:Uncharacterized protein n=1 Tax=Caerostris extrusa TaxID=172846 RepID=A0AAV4NV46_CAEEX|nr:hypothetical protein CEXT_388311 [Caerostris extrusa]
MRTVRIPMIFFRSTLEPLENRCLSDCSPLTWWSSQVALSSSPENQRALDFASFQANYLKVVCKSNQNSLYLKVHLKLCLSM